MSFPGDDDKGLATLAVAQRPGDNMARALVHQTKIQPNSHSYDSLLSTASCEQQALSSLLRCAVAHRYASLEMAVAIPTVAPPWAALLPLLSSCRPPSSPQPPALPLPSLFAMLVSRVLRATKRVQFEPSPTGPWTCVSPLKPALSTQPKGSFLAPTRSFLPC